jgi:hypothetical protein
LVPRQEYLKTDDFQMKFSYLWHSLLRGLFSTFPEGSRMKTHPVLSSTPGVKVRYFVALFLALVIITGCTPVAPQTEKNSVAQATVVPTQQPTPLPTGGPAPQNCPTSAPMETKTFPPGWGGNSGPMTGYGKGLAWGGIQANEVLHFKNTGNDQKFIWAVGPLLHHETVEVSILNLATGQPIPARLNTFYGLDQASDKLTMGPFRTDYFYHPEAGWYVWGSVFQFPAPGCYQVQAKWPGGQWSANFSAGD